MDYQVTVTDHAGNVIFSWSGYADNPGDTLARAELKRAQDVAAV